jgi:GntR family transcriptional regulator/MocR family aminotransferase
LRPDEQTNGLVIGYGSTPAEQLAAAAHLLATLARELDGKAASEATSRPAGKPASNPTGKRTKQANKQGKKSHHPPA